MKCRRCGFLLTEKMPKCPSCGEKLDSAPDCYQRKLTIEQKNFYLQQEKKYEAGMRSAKIWSIICSCATIVAYTVVCFASGENLGALVFAGGVGFIGIVAELICYSYYAGKLEKIQREKLSLDK